MIRMELVVSEGVAEAAVAMVIMESVKMTRMVMTVEMRIMMVVLAVMTVSLMPTTVITPTMATVLTDVPAACPCPRALVRWHSCLTRLL